MGNLKTLRGIEGNLRKDEEGRERKERKKE